MTYQDNETRRVYFNIKRVSRMVNETQTTLRHWEDEGIIGEIPRNNRNSRTYMEKHIDKVEKAQYLLRRMGFEIKGVQQAIEHDYLDSIIKFHQKQVK